MARDIGTKCKRCRRAREKLFLRGNKCLSDKCVLMKRGEESATPVRRRVSAYAIQLREKQKLRMLYGILETQFRNYFVRAAKSPNTAAALLILLERRLDNVIYRLGFADSRSQARQLVRHGHITVDGKKVDIPSYQVKAGQVIAVATERGRKLVSSIVASKEATVVPWLSVNQQQLTGQVLRLPEYEDVKDVPCNMQLIVEFYSK
ncbi:MAG: 30S ribosomal protein S4 [candidate division WOR-3 bacterium]|nr:30S ribosomal protein S4 [candidate division WOR-3 bacterium]MDH7518621.1 30S ribosomal protein S4 [bacterium]